MNEKKRDSTLVVLVEIDLFPSIFTRNDNLFPVSCSQGSRHPHQSAQRQWHQLRGKSQQPFFSFAKSRASYLRWHWPLKNWIISIFYRLLVAAVSSIEEVKETNVLFHVLWWKAWKWVKIVCVGIKKEEARRIEPRFVLLFGSKLLRWKTLWRNALGGWANGSRSGTWRE